MKRFYKLVSLRADEGGYAVLLDGRPVKTPARNILQASTQKLGDALMGEWAAQGEIIKPDEMPLTQITSTKIDRVANERPAMSENILQYLDTDLLCYRTDHPPELASAQAAAWDPVLAWFESRFGAKLSTTTKLEALRQPHAAHEVVRAYVEAQTDERFTALQLVTALSGSLVLALAFTEGHAGPDDVFAAARVEETHKAALYDEAKYGPDPAQEKKDRAVLRDLRAAREYLDFTNL